MTTTKKIEHAEWCPAIVTYPVAPYYGPLTYGYGPCEHGCPRHGLAS